MASKSTEIFKRGQKVDIFDDVEAEPLSAEEFQAKTKEWEATWNVPRAGNEFSIAKWLPQAHLAEVKHQRGKYLQRMGVMCRGRQYLTIEEAVYLVDRGSMLLVCSASEDADYEMSRQECYGLMVPRFPIDQAPWVRNDSLSLHFTGRFAQLRSSFCQDSENVPVFSGNVQASEGVSTVAFQVYSHLMRNGFATRRYPPVWIHNEGPLASIHTQWSPYWPDSRTAASQLEVRQFWADKRPALLATPGVGSGFVSSAGLETVSTDEPAAAIGAPGLVPGHCAELAGDFRRLPVQGSCTGPPRACVQHSGLLGREQTSGAGTCATMPSAGSAVSLAELSPACSELDAGDADEALEIDSNALGAGASRAGGAASPGDARGAQVVEREGQVLATGVGRKIEIAFPRLKLLGRFEPDLDERREERYQLRFAVYKPADASARKDPGAMMSTVALADSDVDGRDFPSIADDCRLKRLCAPTLVRYAQVMSGDLVFVTATRLVCKDMLAR